MAKKAKAVETVEVAPQEVAVKTPTKPTKPSWEIKDRIYYQNKIIKEIVKKKKKINFLDIGCFDGLLLKKLSQNFNDSKF